MENKREGFCFTFSTKLIATTGLPHRPQGHGGIAGLGQRWTKTRAQHPTPKYGSIGAHPLSIPKLSMWKPGQPNHHGETHQPPSSADVTWQLHMFFVVSKPCTPPAHNPAKGQTHLDCHSAISSCLHTGVNAHLNVSETMSCADWQPPAAIVPISLPQPRAPANKLSSGRASMIWIKSTGAHRRSKQILYD